MDHHDNLQKRLQLARIFAPGNIPQQTIKEGRAI
jgi:hypothetical protein